MAETYIDGLNLRRIGRQIHINHQTVANWINKLTKKIDPEQAPISELGELSTFVGQKKNRIYLVTQVHRKAGCFMNWLTISERTAEQMQPIVDGSAQAFQYCSDGASVYEALNYHRGYHLVAEGKTQTYSVEAKNAELRHYLARLAKHTRCFSRSLEALRGAIALFIDCWNRRQLHKLKYPRYNYSLIDFLPLVN